MEPRVFALTTLPLLLLMLVVLGNNCQPTIKKATHMTFFKWVTHNNDLSLVPTGDLPVLVPAATTNGSGGDGVGGSSHATPTTTRGNAGLRPDSATESRPHTTERSATSSGHVDNNNNNNNNNNNDDDDADDKNNNSSSNNNNNNNNNNKNDNDRQAMSDEAKRILDYLRQRKNRRSSRRRCANGACRRGNSNSRLLRTLSAKLPKMNQLVEADDDVDGRRDKDVNLLDLLDTGKAPPQVLMSIDKVRENFCKTQPFAQTIQLPGCHPKTVINNFCYGQCNSFFIPNHSAGPFRTCGNCEANKTHKLKVNLVCPGRVEGVHTVYVEKVLSCACISRPSDMSHGS